MGTDAERARIRKRNAETSFVRERKPAPPWCRVDEARAPARGSADASGAHHPGLARLRHGGACRGVFAELVAQRADRDAEDLRGMRAIAEAVVERIEDEILLDLRDGASDERAGDGLRGPRRTRRGIEGGGPERLAFRRADSIDVDLGPCREQHRAMHRVLELAHVAAP